MNTHPPRIPLESLFKLVFWKLIAPPPGVKTISAPLLRPMLLLVPGVPKLSAPEPVPVVMLWRPTLKVRFMLTVWALPAPSLLTMSPPN